MAARGDLVREDGSIGAVDGHLPADLPLGYHELRTDGAARGMEHHLKGLHYMGRLACGASPARTTRPSPPRPQNAPG